MHKMDIIVAKESRSPVQKWKKRNENKNTIVKNVRSSFPTSQQFIELESLKKNGLTSMSLNFWLPADRNFKNCHPTFLPNHSSVHTNSF